MPGAATEVLENPVDRPKVRDIVGVITNRKIADTVIHGYDDCAVSDTMSEAATESLVNAKSEDSISSWCGLGAYTSSIAD